MIEFTGENVPIDVVAQVMKKDKNYVRQGIQRGMLTFGVCFKPEGSTQYSYYISPKKFYEETGYIYKGK